MSTRQSHQTKRPERLESYHKAQAIPHAILASTLLTSQTEPNGEQSKQKCTLSTGWAKAVDEYVLAGGIDGVVEVAVEGPSTDRTELMYKLILTHLLSSLDSVIFIITLPGSFSAKRLYHLLCEKRRSSSHGQFKHSGGYVYSRVSRHEATTESKNLEEEAKDLMRRVQLMPVFDFKGCLEAVSEIRQRVTSQGRETDVGSFVHGLDVPVDEQQDCPKAQRIYGVVMEEQVDGTTHHAKVIADSQASSALSDIAGEPENAAPAHAQEEISHQRIKASVPEPPNLSDGQQNTAPNLLIIPTLPQLISPSMRHNHVRGHALMADMLRTLQHLSAAQSARPAAQSNTQALISVLFNTTVGGKSSEAPSSRDQPSYSDALDSTNVSGVSKHRKTDPCFVPSAFADNGDLRPALGKTLGYFVDVCCLVSFVRSASAVTAAGASEEAAWDKRMKRVIEVLWDKNGTRTGRWGVLDE